MLKTTPNIEENIITIGETENKNTSTSTLNNENENQNATKNNINNVTTNKSEKNLNEINGNKNIYSEIYDDCSMNSYTKGGDNCEVDLLKTFLIDQIAFFHFYNKIQNCNILFKKRESNKVNPLESDYSEKNKLDESIDLYKCCICFENTNDILLDCAVKISKNF